MSTNNGVGRPITETARLVLKTMAEDGVPLSPENYHVWFEYVEGANADLCSAVDHIRRSGAGFTEESTKKLFDVYVVPQHAGDLLMKAQKETQAILRSIFDEILSNTNIASEYGDKLRNYSDRLNETSNLGEIQLIVAELIHDTTVMAETSEQFKERLDTVAKDAERLREKLVTAERAAQTDPLTGLNNRKGFNERIGDLFENYLESDVEFSVIMMDIDHFKSFNDTYGHKVGDEVLQMMAGVLKRCLKKQEFAARLGGEEFVLLLPATPLETACRLAEFIRKQMSEQRLVLARTGEAVRRVTLSLGVAVVRPRDTAESLLERADQALYFAKNSGRNQVKAERDARSAARRMQANSG